MLNRNIVVKEELDSASIRGGDSVDVHDGKSFGSETKYDDLSNNDMEVVDTLEICSDCQKMTLNKEEHFEYRRSHTDRGVWYKKIKSTVIMNSVQIGIRNSVGGMASKPERDVLMQDFMTVESTTYTATDVELNNSHRNPNFVFKTYAPIAFRHFRDLFGIRPDHYVSSFCSSSLIELPNPGSSGSLLYLTEDDEFILKTVQHKEANFLQKLLPGYYLNLNQNPNTLLPKFFGLYCCQQDSTNVRLVAMNNVLPSWVRIHQKYDLKGSTYKRSASKKELENNIPTFKDLDFKEHHPDGFYLDNDVYKNLMITIQRDCRVLESFQIIDYSLLLGVHNLDQAKRENLLDQDDPTEQTNQELRNESGDGDRQPNVDGNQSNEVHEAIVKSQTCDDEGTNSSDGAIKKVKTNISQKGIPAKLLNGDNILLFIGIIDILQSYKLSKRMEHVWKSIVHDSSSVSVQNPAFYAQRFQEFLSSSVFKLGSSPAKSNKRKSLPKIKNDDKRITIL